MSDLAYLLEQARQIAVDQSLLLKLSREKDARIAFLERENKCLRDILDRSEAMKTYRSISEILGN
jgi:hypothetical protein